MHAVILGQRLTAAAAIAGFAATVIAGGASGLPEIIKVRGAPHSLGMRAAMTTPPTEAKATPEKRCFDALRPVFAKSTWKITIERGMNDCFGSLPDETFDIDSQGHVLWKAKWMPDRRIELSLGERPLLEGIVGVSCHGEVEHHEELDFLNIYPAGTSRDDADWPIEWSPARETLEMLVLRLKTRYFDERRQELGTITLDVRVRDNDTRRWYRARVADDILVVSRGGRVLLRKALTKADVVELVDWVGVQAPAHDKNVIGWLVAGNKRTAVALDEALGPVLHDVGDAMYCEAHRDSSFVCP